MSDKKEKRNMAIKKIPSYFASNLKTLFISNLLFAAPLVLIQLVLWAVSAYLFPLNIFVILLPIALLFPLYGGITQVTKDIAADRPVRPIKTFIKGIKENFKQMLVFGILFYFAVVMDYFALIFYYSAGTVNWVFFIVFALSIFILIFLLFMFYYVPIITVSIKLNIRSILKDAALMSVYELPTNLVITFFLAAFVAVISTLFFLISDFLISIIVFSILCLAIIPIAISLIINALTYPKIEKMLFKNKDEVKDNAEKKPAKSTAEELSDITVTEEMLNSKDDYIFINGRMIKREALEKYRRNNIENSED